MGADYFPWTQLGLPYTSYGPVLVIESTTGGTEYSELTPLDTIDTLSTERPPTLGTVKTESKGEQSYGEWLYDSAAHAYDTTRYFGRTHVEYLRIELYTAGTTITETGHALGDFVGDHASNAYYDPEGEWDRVKEGANATWQGVEALGTQIYNDPWGSLQSAGSGTLNYLDQLTKDPTVSGKLLGDAGVTWATGGASAAGKKVAQEVVGTLWDLGKNLRRVPDVGHAEPVAVEPRGTGARWLDRWDDADYDRAEEVYEQLRNTTNDIDDIVENSGIPRSQVERVKNHLFHNDHILDEGVRKFHADPEIANAWRRLREGIATDADRQLFRHEQAESIFEQLFGGSYRDAHNKINPRFPSPL